MRTAANISELNQLIALCTSTFFNLYGFLPDAEELSRQIGIDCSKMVAGYSGTPLPAEDALAS